MNTTVEFKNDAGQVEATVTIDVDYEANKTHFKMTMEPEFYEEGKPSMTQSFAIRLIRSLQDE